MSLILIKIIRTVLTSIPLRLNQNTGVLEPAVMTEPTFGEAPVLAVTPLTTGGAFLFVLSRWQRHFSIAARTPRRTMRGSGRQRPTDDEYEYQSICVLGVRGLQWDAFGFMQRSIIRSDHLT